MGSWCNEGTVPNEVRDLLVLSRSLATLGMVPSSNFLPSYLPTFLPSYFPTLLPSYQVVATAPTIRASPTRSFKSITSAGECEYRRGHPIAASGTP